MTLRLIVDGEVVTNTTSISDAPAVSITGNNVQFTNSGTGRLVATSNSYALSAAITIDGAGTTITNQFGGIIGAYANGWTAIRGSNYADTIINSGSINGAVLLGDGNDSFTQRGATPANMSVDLGAGDDIYRNETSSTPST